VAHSMTDSSVVPIDVGAGAREQALPPEAGEPKEQGTQSALDFKGCEQRCGRPQSEGAKCVC
jgi:hypothetical protein